MSYSTLGKIKKQYEKMREEKLRLTSYSCYKNNLYRCSGCFSRERDCEKCNNPGSKFLEIFNAASSYKNRNCHICELPLEIDWYYCNKCKSYKKEKCSVTPKTLSFHCNCLTVCCGKYFCGNCTQDYKDCELCEAVYCNHCGAKHAKVKCNCGKYLCLVDSLFSTVCSEECAAKYIRDCNICDGKYTVNETDIGACRGCVYGHKKKIDYDVCCNCNKFSKVKYYRQRDKISQERIPICISCKKDAIGNCDKCNCCLILFQNRFYYNNDRIAVAFTENDNSIFCRKTYTCSRPNCNNGKILPFETIEFTIN